MFPQIEPKGVLRRLATGNDGRRKDLYAMDNTIENRSDFDKEASQDIDAEFDYLEDMGYQTPQKLNLQMMKNSQPPMRSSLRKFSRFAGPERIVKPKSNLPTTRIDLNRIEPKLVSEEIDDLRLSTFIPDKDKDSVNDLEGNSPTFKPHNMDHVDYPEDMKTVESRMITGDSVRPITKDVFKLDDRDLHTMATPAFKREVTINDQKNTSVIHDHETES